MCGSFPTHNKFLQIGRLPAALWALDLCEDDKGMGAAHKYLLSLLPLYKKTGNEAYVLSKLLCTESVPVDVQSLFCARCLVLFEPNVNCRVEETHRYIRIVCNTCGSKTAAAKSKKTTVSHAEVTQELEFEDLFMWIP
eukprot:jgi/Antlo1/1659/2180